jgi:hypothetical protein
VVQGDVGDEIVSSDDRCPPSDLFIRRPFVHCLGRKVAAWMCIITLISVSSGGDAPTASQRAQGRASRSGRTRE